MGTCIDNALVLESKDGGGIMDFSLKSEHLLGIEDVERFLQKATTHPVLSKRFKNIDSSRMIDLAKRIRILLNYAFKYDRLDPFQEVFKIHRMMSITQEEVLAFRDLFLEECCPANLKPSSVQKKIMDSIGTSILQGNRKKSSANNVLFFYRSVSTNPILRHRFENITPNRIDLILKKFMSILKPGVKEDEFIKLARMHHHLYLTKLEYDEFTKLFLQRYRKDSNFVDDAKPIIEKLRGYMITEDADHTMKLYNRFKTNPVLSKRFTILQPKQTKAILMLMLELIEDPNYLDKMEKLAESHLDLKITEEEFVEFEKVFLQVCSKNRDFDVKLKTVIGELKLRLMVKTE